MKSEQIAYVEFSITETDPLHGGNYEVIGIYSDKKKTEEIEESTLSDNAIRDMHKGCRLCADSPGAYEGEIDYCQFKL